MDLLSDIRPPTRSNAHALRRRLVDGLTLEASPQQLADPSDPSCPSEPATRLRPGTEVYLPALRSTRPEDTLAAAALLLARGLHPVPHLAARRFESQAALDRCLAGLREAGVDRVLLLAGDVDRPAGPFTSALDVLRTGRLERYGIGRIGIAGHPEDHPAVPAAALDQALDAKAAYADAAGLDLWLTTQFVFTAAPIIAWLDRLSTRGHRLPVRVGVAGPTTTAKLLRFALQCGVGTSARVLARRPDAARMLGRWEPGAVVDTLAGELARVPEHTVAGLHVFPFGGLKAALDWRETKLAEIP